MDTGKQSRARDIILKLREHFDHGPADASGSAALQQLGDLEKCLEKKRERMRALKRKCESHKEAKAQRKVRKKRKLEQSVLRERWEAQRRSEWETDKSDKENDKSEGEDDDEDEDEDEDEDAGVLCAECKETEREHECTKCEKPVCETCTDGFGESPWLCLEAGDKWMCPECVQDAAMLYTGHRIEYIECENGGMAKATFGPSFW